MTRSQTKDMIWHGFKTLLCAVQFWILAYLVESDFVGSLESIEAPKDVLNVLIHLLHPTIICILFFVIWHYYDTIDDRSFHKVCKASEPPKFLRDPAYILGIVLTTLAVTPVLTFSFRIFFRYLGVTDGVTVLSIFVALIVAAGGSTLRVSRLNTVWVIQSKLPHAKKPPSVPLRVFYAVTFFIALVILSNAVTVAAFIFSAVLLGFFIPLLVIAGLILLWCFAILPALNLPTRRKFMHRLQELQARGKVRVEIHGHPYLSLFFGLVPFGLTITDKPHPDARVQEDRVYQVTFANSLRRREIVILCEHNIYQFVYSLKFNHVTRFSRMGANKAESRGISLPGAAWFVNRTFDFPEGEGERILLVDPTPTVLAVRHESGQSLFELDNASQVFGYTVYGKNSFLNVLERS